MTKIMRLILPLFYVCLLTVPISVFLYDKGGLSIFEHKDLGSLAANIFPLFGLYACILLWSQIIIGTQMSALRNIFPNIERFHRGQGVFALCLALGHPILLVVSTGLAQYLSYSFVSPDQRIFAIMGQVQIFLLLMTVFSALFMKYPLLKQRWHTIHYLNYLIFGLILIHSWNIGSDLAINNILRVLWLILGISAALALLIRITLTFQNKYGKIPKNDLKRKIEQEENIDPSYAAVANIGEVESDKGTRVTVNNKDLGIFKINDDFFAIADRCTHAGASLSNGSVRECEVECPAHGAKFDIRNGSVVSGPAKKNLDCYKVRLRNEHIEVEIPT